MRTFRRPSPPRPPAPAPGVANNVSEARLPGFLLSLLLHLGVFALVLFVPVLGDSPPPPPPTGPMILGPVTIGREGRPATARKPEAAQADRQEPRAPERPQERPEPKPTTAQRPPVETPPKPTASAKPQVDPNALVLPQKQPQTNATAKPEPQKNATAKAPEKPAPKPEPAKSAAAKAPEKPAAKPEPAKPRGDSLAAALKNLEKDAKGSAGSSGKSTGRGAMSGALDDLRAEVGGGGGTDASGDGPGGRGGDGVGIVGAYGESVVSRVRPNWSLPGQARNYTTVVNVYINPDGTVQRAEIVRSSGNSYIDSSVVQAVMASHLEAPPPGYSEVEITFNTDDLAH